MSDDQENDVYSGKFIRTRTRIAAILMGVGAALHPFDSARALRIIADKLDGDTEDTGV